MGPTTIFDKSALQALSLDESVWFESFFWPNMVPLFYVETLADLEKDVAEGRRPEDTVGIIAEKTPRNALANVHHRDLVSAELAGYRLPLGKPVIADAQTMQASDATVGLHVQESTETIALRRWQRREFVAVERDGARQWRAQLAAHDPRHLVAALGSLLPTGQRLTSLEALKSFIDEFCATRDPHVIELVLQILGLPNTVNHGAVARWRADGQKRLDEYWPYATHVAKVDLLFYLGIARGFISGERPSNRVDMAYLYYVPFADVFTSGDRLHHRTVPLFQTGSQTYLEARNLKAALAELDEYYDALTAATKRRGVMAFASWPPSTIDNAVTQLWDRHMRPDWRAIAAERESRPEQPRDEAADAATVQELRERLEPATPVPDDTPALNQTHGPDYWLVSHYVAPRKGKWQILPDDVATPDSGRDSI